MRPDEEDKPADGKLQAGETDSDRAGTKRSEPMPHTAGPVDLPRESKATKVMDYRSEELPVEKAVALTGAFTFKEAAKEVNSGTISINGELARLGQPVRSDALLSHLGNPLPPRAPVVYYLLNKPRGVMTAVSDGPWKRSAQGGTVLDLVPPYPRVVPVGRLDFDSEGLLILTNDGSFVAAATSPLYQLDKVYLALLESKRKDRYSGVPPSDLLERMRAEGVEVHGDRFRCTQLAVEAAEAESERGLSARSWVRVVLQEGKKREVRRLFACVGYNVLRLVRVGIHEIHGPCAQQARLSFEPSEGSGGRREDLRVQMVDGGRELEPGQARLLTSEEVDAVFAHCQQRGEEPAGQG